MNQELNKKTKSLEDRIKEVWAKNLMLPAILLWDKNHPNNPFTPLDTEKAYKEFYGKDIMDESNPVVVCGWCDKPKGEKNSEKDTDCQCGRPTKYSEEIIKRAKMYLKDCEDEEEEFHKTRGDKSDGYERRLKVKLPSIGGLAYFLDISRETLYEWEKEYPMFSDIMTRLRSKQEERLINNSLSGDYNANIAKVLLTKHGYRDAVETYNQDVPVDPVVKEKADKAIGEFLKTNNVPDRDFAKRNPAVVNALISNTPLAEK